MLFLTAAGSAENPIRPAPHREEEWTCAHRHYITWNINCAPMPPRRESNRPDDLSNSTPKGILFILAFFSRHHQGLCKDVTLDTGLSERTVRRRLEELKKAGVLEAVQTKTFPSARRFRLTKSSEHLAQAAEALLQELHE